MLKVRDGVFETNSSSMHSLIIGKNAKLVDNYYSLPLDENGILKYDYDDLELKYINFKIMNTLESKLNYLIAISSHIQSKNYFKSVNRVLLLILNDIPELKNNNILIKGIKHIEYISEDFEGYSNLEICNRFHHDCENCEYYYYCELDNKIMDKEEQKDIIENSSFIRILRENNITLEQYLTDPKVIVIKEHDSVSVYYILNELLGLIGPLELSVDLPYN